MVKRYHGKLGLSKRNRSVIQHQTSSHTKSFKSQIWNKQIMDIFPIPTGLIRLELWRRAAWYKKKTHKKNSMKDSTSMVGLVGRHVPRVISYHLQLIKDIVFFSPDWCKVWRFPTSLYHHTVPNTTVINHKMTQEFTSSYWCPVGGPLSARTASPWPCMWTETERIRWNHGCTN